MRTFHADCLRPWLKIHAAVRFVDIWHACVHVAASWYLESQCGQSRDETAAAASSSSQRRGAGQVINGGGEENSAGEEMSTVTEMTPITESREGQRGEDGDGDGDGGEKGKEKETDRDRAAGNDDMTWTRRGLWTNHDARRGDIDSTRCH